jgi:hypothetical protein
MLLYHRSLQSGQIFYSFWEADQNQGETFGSVQWNDIPDWVKRDVKGEEKIAFTIRFFVH